jgi:hypothetical protein
MNIIRTINTASKEIVKRHWYNLPEHSIKPRGLWYSIGDEWIEWVRKNMPEWEHSYNHTIVVDESKLLIISTFIELEAFISAYKKDEYNIDWKAIRSRYMGIEFRNYGDIRHRTFDKFNILYTFYWGLDCSCGCIWNMNCITF